MALKVHKAKRVAPYKKEAVKRIVSLIKKYPIIGAMNMENLPAAQLQRMKSQLRGKVEMFMTKRRMMNVAIEEAKAEKKDIEKIKEHLKGMPALIFTNENPFSLFKTLKKSKTKAPAKAGQTAPSDIMVRAGPTPFAPGPVIGELGALKVKTKVEAGKVAIVQDTVVCRAGEQISGPLAGMLARLGIEPMEIGLNITAVYEKGEIFTKSVLDIDEDKFKADLSNAARWAFNLSCETAYLTKENRVLLIQKAFRDAKALALSQDILADAVVKDILSKAERQMLSLKSMLPEAPAAAPKEEPKAEEKKEGPKPEAKAEQKPHKAEEKKEHKEHPKPEHKPEHKEKPKEEKKEIKAEKKEEKKAEPKPEHKAEAKPAEHKAEEKATKEAKAEVKKPEQKPAHEVHAEKKAEAPAQAVMPHPQTAVQIVEEVKKEVEKAPEVRVEKKQKEEKEGMEKVEALAQQLLKKGSLRGIAPQKEGEKQKKKKKSESEKTEVEKVEDLTAQLMRKGTLRK